MGGDEITLGSGWLAGLLAPAIPESRYRLAAQPVNLPPDRRRRPGPVAGHLAPLVLGHLDSLVGAGYRNVEPQPGAGQPDHHDPLLRLCRHAEGYQVIDWPGLLVDVPGHRVEAAAVTAKRAVVEGGLLQLQQHRPGLPVLGFPGVDYRLGDLIVLPGEVGRGDRLPADLPGVDALAGLVAVLIDTVQPDPFRRRFLPDGAGHVVAVVRADQVPLKAPVPVFLKQLDQVRPALLGSPLWFGDHPLYLCSLITVP